MSGTARDAIEYALDEAFLKLYLAAFVGLWVWTTDWGDLFGGINADGLRALVDLLAFVISFVGFVLFAAGVVAVVHRLRSTREGGL